MSPIEIGSAAIAALILLIYLGMPIGIGMLLVSLLGVATIRNETVAIRMMASVANDSLEEYLFAVVPLFVLMGLLVTVSGVGLRDRSRSSRGTSQRQCAVCRRAQRDRSWAAVYSACRESS
jgi:TRAP-type mannitol/chloroaromatic compound transport system permease large subunit